MEGYLALRNGLVTFLLQQRTLVVVFLMQKWE